MKFKPMTPEQVTRGVCMRRCAWGKRVQQLADESGVPERALIDLAMGSSELAAHGEMMAKPVRSERL